MYYFGARYLDPLASRWASPDPAGEKLIDKWVKNNKDSSDPYKGKFITNDISIQELDWYVYANNNPVKYIDPTGLKVEIAYRAVIPGVAYHTLLILTDDKTGKKTVIEGMPRNQVSGAASSPSSASGSSSGSSSGGSSSGSSGYGYGDLIKKTVTKLSSLSKDQIETVPTPKGMTDSEFRAQHTEAYNSYGNDVKYSPLPGGEEGNSNSLVGSVLRAADSEFKTSKWCPGWDQNVTPQD